ncbi:MAG: glutamate-5-semialdehyde dehydrogenase [Candidatus Marinimicrobia bacterium]|jgi:glutamate-5-semialdehyde dehydrogenase|nr:glutamate-5-semialdehyde dehydrogenase [Candidatus Neomarinimicrobiota bacterium]MBT3936818.1 glutamate-5-semialdehyde dehydrogenase [Candidatus Neomarinimicrobiota bacterium]MBT3961987.1 glutamate-5-semialdehyde dehydrogenase [Candidatus Neomarinimicrobiota bacterium]MBT4383677.1 glutamate-5-semialdehyde dehydrogenase [Candidatus Neomarinimicrobiota bacterium]MBT4637152.1 glutamate-5-semialdehyde dehydrogenase [Candidatus Neomarinimicrobiota bacterium]
MSLKEIGQRIKSTSQILSTITTIQKQTVLNDLANAIINNNNSIKSANEKDLVIAKSKGLSSAMIDRLQLTDDRIQSMAVSVKEVATLHDPVGEIAEEYTRPNGLQVQRRRIPLGVIGVIYESRPNVTIEAASLCFFAGNGLLLRGGSEAFHSNMELVRVMRTVLKTYNLEGVIDIVPSTDRANIDEMAKMNDVLDVIIPRGGEGLIRHIYSVATVPVIAHYKGNCHVYVDKTANINKAIAIVMNGKVQRPGVCNSLETLLIHKSISNKFLPRIIDKLVAAKVEIRGCDVTQSYSDIVVPATNDDYDTEFLELILSVKVIDSLDDAISHIQQFTSDHTEAIISQDQISIDTFIQSLDSSAIIVNASTRFNDGGELGLGAEIGISTTKLHSFGPMGLRELTTTKFVVTGNGQVRE